MPPLTPTVIEMLGVEKAFDRPGQDPVVAITDIYATIANDLEHGEFVTILGPSGCGKSTLLQMMAGFDTHIPPTKGTVKFHGEIVTGTSPMRGMLFQAYGCYPHLTVLQNIAFGLTLHQDELSLSGQEIENRAYHWLNKVRLQYSDGDKYPHELSGGMRQRVALARSLALEPECLLMDEPFSALDEPTRFEMQDLIVELWDKIEATIVTVSHSVSEAVFLGDRVWVMSKAPGTIVAEYSEIPKPSPDVPASVQQSEPEFTDMVGEITRAFEAYSKTPRGRLKPIFANGRVCNGSCDYKKCDLRLPARFRRTQSNQKKRNERRIDTSFLSSDLFSKTRAMAAFRTRPLRIKFPLEVEDAGRNE